MVCNTVTNFSRHYNIVRVIQQQVGVAVAEANFSAQPILEVLTDTPYPSVLLSYLVASQHYLAHPFKVP